MLHDRHLGQWILLFLLHPIPSSAFSSLASSSCCRQQIPLAPPASFRTSFSIHRGLAARKDKNDDDEEAQTGMEEAFRQLGALESLDKVEGKESTVKFDEQSKAELRQKESSSASMEEEAKLFTGMLEDSEQGETELYSDVMKEMGGTPKEAPNDEDKPPRQITIVEETSSSLPSTTSTIPRSEEDTKKFMDQAIQEALEEAKSMAPDGSKSFSDSILDDEKIMKEIEEIFEKGNEKLLASLEEIREEQRELAKESAEKRSQVALDKLNDEKTQRLAQAQASMEQQLGVVDKERAEVERAVADLKRAQEDLESDPLSKLTSNAFKPAALAGVILFAARSVLDFLAMSAGGIEGEAHLTAALIQGGIALVCAVYFLFG